MEEKSVFQNKNNSNFSKTKSIEQVENLNAKSSSSFMK